MPGPTKPFLAPAAARGGQYVTVPAFASPGHSSPSNTRDAPGSTIVYSPKGWRWEEAGDDYSKTVSKLTAATMESAVRRIKTSMGEVFYIRGTADTVPPFGGSSVGDTCRVQDAQTLDIVAEWKWDGASWERMRVTSEQISNLDVGKLTAGAANIAEITARKIASDVGRFLEITTDQLTVTGNASFVNATAHHVWTEIITAGEGEFERIKAGMLDANSVNASNIQAGAIDGQVITGATIQTSRTSNRGLKISDYGMQVYASNGWKALDINAQTGAINISGHIGRRDSWSQVWLNDIYSRESGGDEHNGLKWGCGLAFNSNEDDWWDGTLTLVKASTGDPSLRLQGPYPKRLGKASPYISVGTAAISMYTPAGNGSLSFNSSGINLQAKDVYWWMNDRGFSFGSTKDNNSRLYLGKDELDIRPFNSTFTSKARIWADGSKIAMQFNQANQVWISSEGVHLTGNKQFAMRVPKATKARGGMWLTHSCTESPYDGLEYWENVTLDESGHAIWTLPDYVPLIASSKAPWVVFTSDGARAILDRSRAEEWRVEISGTPGAVVAVLVKGARMIDHDIDESGEPVMRDYARESMWILPPTGQASGGGMEDGGPQYGDSVTMGGNYYGPAPDPALESNR